MSLSSRDAQYSVPTNLVDGTQRKIQNTAAAPLPTAPTVSGQDPNRNPSYLAFLRGAGLDENQARQQADRSRTRISTQLEAQRPVWAQQREQGVRGAMTDAASRGMNRSSNRIENQNQVNIDMDRRIADAERQAAWAIEDTDSDLNYRLGRAAIDREQAAISAQQQLYGQAASAYQNELSRRMLLQNILNDPVALGDINTTNFLRQMGYF